MNINKINLETKKAISNKIIAIVSDIHISEETSEQTLVEILKNLELISPTQIVIPGDLYNVDDSTVYESGSNVTNFLNEASNIADVFYVQGNMELKSDLLPYRIYNNGNPKLHVLCSTYASYTNGKREYQYEEMINDGDMNIAGIILEKDFYYQNENAKIQILLSKYREYLEKLSAKCNPQNFNVLLCHDPIIADVSELLQNFDLVISGHNHGGLFPPTLKPFFKIIGANLELLYPKYTKGIIKKGSSSFVISEGITKFHSESGALQKLQRFNEGTIEVVKVKTLNKN